MLFFDNNTKPLWQACNRCKTLASTGMNSLDVGKGFLLVSEKPKMAFSLVWVKPLLGHERHRGASRTCLLLATNRSLGNIIAQMQNDSPRCTNQHAHESII